MLIHAENYGDIDDLLPLPNPSHHVVALTNQEAAVAKEFGCHRVMSRLVLDCGHFPIPPWIDRDRSDVTRMADNAGTIHVTVPVARARIHGLSAIMVDDSDIVLHIPADMAKSRAFQEHVGCTLSTDAVSLESFIP
jgi:hypothetical protein